MEIEAIKKIKLEPGEVLFVQFPDEVSADTMDAGIKMLVNFFPNNKIVGYVGSFAFHTIAQTDIELQQNQQIPITKVKW